MYGKTLPCVSQAIQILPYHLYCGHFFDINQALCCPVGILPKARRNKLWDLTAELLSGVFHHVSIRGSSSPGIGLIFYIHFYNKLKFSLLAFALLHYFSPFLFVCVCRGRTGSNFLLLLCCIACREIIVFVS